jgi:hypothetical protein
MSEFTAAEIQGPYGPLTIPEQVLQKIWNEKRYVGDMLVTNSGKTLTVEYPGLWNHQEGPDFLNARLQLDGKPLLGDVEIHFYDKDWVNHGHHQNPEFNRVVLHVVLFPSQKSSISTQSGNPVETLVFLPYLETDLEQYVLDYRLTRLEQTGEMPLVDLLAPLNSEDFLDHFWDASMVRWEAKVEAHAHRLKETSWEEACHQLLLESLGGRRNRAAFAKIALEYPLSEWVGGDLTPGDLFANYAGEWRLSGILPAGHPRVRLQQYFDLVSVQPNWASRLLELPLTNEAQFDASMTAHFRRNHELSKLLKNLRSDVFNNIFSEALVSTLAADMFLPMLSAQGSHTMEPYWYHWFPGNFPEPLAKFLRHQCVERDIKVPLSNGLQQGLLKMMNEVDR